MLIADVRLDVVDAVKRAAAAAPHALVDRAVLLSAAHAAAGLLQFIPYTHTLSSHRTSILFTIVIIDTVINSLLGGLTLDPAGMHCPSWDDAFVSSWKCRHAIEHI